MRTIDWVDGRIELIDQTLLPHELKILRRTNLDDLIDDIQRLAVRGAPALGVAGALGMALIANQNANNPPQAQAEALRLRNARPTAVNLSWAVDLLFPLLGTNFLPDGGQSSPVPAPSTATNPANPTDPANPALGAVGQINAAAVLEAALKIRDEDIASCVSMGQYGADLIESLVNKPKISVMTICNTGALACVERGTALGVIQTMHERGTLQEAFPIETRPLLQGARLTTWELTQMGAPFRLLVDSAGPFLLNQGLADAVFIGADRIAANGDTANKIGSFSLALAAKRAGVPFIVVAPESTVDLNTPTGADIEIEDRGSAEVVTLADTQTATTGTQALNPAFDVTPHDLISAVVTDRRVVRPSLGETMHDIPLGPTRK